MSGTLNFLIKGKDTGRGGRIWRSQVWSGTGSSSDSFARPLLFDTLKKGGLSPDVELDVVDFPWSPTPKLKKHPSTSSISNQIHKSLLEFDEMLDEFEADDEETVLFTQSPTSLTPSKNLFNALGRSASKNLLTRRSTSSLKRTYVTSNDKQEGIYEMIDDRANLESGYTTAEQESTTSNSITSASSGISSASEKRRQTYGQLAENFDIRNDIEESGFNEESDLNDQEFILPPLPINFHFENTDDDECATRESSFDYEAIMRKKKPKHNAANEDLGLSEYELGKLNQFLQDDEVSPQGEVGNDSSSLNDECRDTVAYQTDDNHGRNEGRFGHNDDVGVMDELRHYLNRNIGDSQDGFELGLDSKNNFNDEESSSRLSNPSTLTNGTPVFQNIPPPPDFIPPPPPDFVPLPPQNYFPPPPQHLLEQDDHSLDGVENYTINFDDETPGIYDIPDDVQQYDYYDTNHRQQYDDEGFHQPYISEELPEPVFDSFNSFVPDTPQLSPPEEFPWAAGDDGEEEGSASSSLPPPPAPPPPPPDWSPVPYRSSESTHQKSETPHKCHVPFDMSALKESLGNIKLKKVSDEELSPRSPQNNGVSDAVGMIANMILSGAYKLKPSSAGVAIRNEGGTIKDGDSCLPVPPIDTDDTIYVNASELDDPCDPHGPPSNERCAPPPAPSNSPAGLLNQKNQNVVEAPIKPKLNQKCKYETLNIDVSQIPGYQEVPESAAPWKRDMIERKNQQLLQKFTEEKENRKLEEQKWRDVPEWKRNLLMEKERKKIDNPVINMFKPKQPPVVLKKSEAVARWKQREAAQNL